MNVGSVPYNLLARPSVWVIALNALCLVAFAGVGLAEPGRPLAQVSVLAQGGWPDKHFTVDAAGNISPQQDYVHSGQTAVWTFATASPANRVSNSIANRRRASDS